MRFGTVHRIMVDALATLGVLSVVTSASLSMWTNGFLLAGLVGAVLVPEAWQSQQWLRLVSAAAPLALFIVQSFRLITGAPALDVAVEFAALLQIFRMATRRGAAHDQHIIVLALLHLVAGTVLGGGLAYGFCFLGFLVVAPGALVLSHLRREVEGNYRQGARDRTGLPVDVPRILRSRRVVGSGFLAATCLMAVPILAFTGALFVLFPRVGLSLLLVNTSHHGRMVGFSDHVDLGEVGVLRSDPTVALRFTVPDLAAMPPDRLTLRLRGTAFDSYNGRAWVRSESERRTADPHRNPKTLYAVARTPDPTKDRLISFDLEPIDPPVIFLPTRTVGFRVTPAALSRLSGVTTVERGPEGEFRYSASESRGLRYDVFLAQDNEVFVDHLSGTDKARYLIVPPSLPSRIADLAHTWTDSFLGDLAKAKSLEDHLRRDYRYDLGSPSGGTPQPVDHFLFESHRGHCEFFSTSMAVMLRSIGIPARNVTGFVGGTYNRFGKYYAVREGDAHSWVEAYISDGSRGSWVTFDPTPPAAVQPLQNTNGPIAYLRDMLDAVSQRWVQYVVGYDIRTQSKIFESVAMGYESMRARAGFNRGLWEKTTRASTLAGVSLVTVLAIYLWWRRPSRRSASQKPLSDALPTEKTLESVVALYRSLEAVLVTHGIARPVSVPPLRHAENLERSEHPLAREVRALTEIYLAARFGGAELTPPLRRDFEGRIKVLRHTRPLRTESTSQG